MQIIQDTNFGQLLGNSLGQGLQGLLNLKMQQAQEQNQIAALQYLMPNATMQQLRGFANLDPRILQGFLKGGQAAQAQQTAATRARDLLANIQELEKEGGIDKFLGRLGGSNADIYDAQSKELAAVLKQIDPALQVPTSKQNASARAQLIERAQNALGLGQAPMPTAQQSATPTQAPLDTAAQQQLLSQQTQPDQNNILQRVLGGAGNVGINTLPALLQLAGRAGSGTLSRALPVVGQGILASDLVQLGENLLPDIQSKLVGMLPFVDPEVKKQAQKQILEQEPKQIISQYLPTTENIKKIVSQALPDQFFEPKSQIEKDMQDYVEKAVTIFGFGGGTAKKALMRAAAAKAGGLGARQLGLGPVGEKVSELVFTLGPDIISQNVRGQLRQAAGSVYERFAQKNNNKTLELPEVKKQIEKILQRAEKYQSLPYNKDIANGMNDILDKFQRAPGGEVADVRKALAEGVDLRKLRPGKVGAGTNIRVEDAIDNKRAVWRMIDSYNLQKPERAALTELAVNMGDSIAQQAKKQKLPLIKEFEKANQIWRGVSEGESLYNTLKEAYNSKEIKSFLLRSLIGRFPVASGVTFATKLAGLPFAESTAAGLAAAELYQAYKFMTMTPGSWQKLAQATLYSAKNNKAAAQQILRSLDKQALAFEKQQEQRQKQRSKRGLQR